MSSTPTVPRTLHYVDHSPVRGLAIAERRVEEPEATLICIHGGLDRLLRKRSHGKEFVLEFGELLLKMNPGHAIFSQ